MNAVKHPWFKFSPSDWRSDPALRSCSIGARGLWIEMLALMHEAEPYGSLLVKGKRPDKKLLAALVGIPERECIGYLMELEGYSVFSRDDDGTIYSRRMRRDHAKAIRDKENGKGGGNPRLKEGVNPPDKAPDNEGDKAKKLEARSQNISIANAMDSARKRGTRLAEDWMPPANDLLAAQRKLGVGGTQDELAKFHDYWKAQPGQRGVKLDWDATFRNWIRNARGPQSHAKTESRVIQAANDLCRKIASFDGPTRGPDELRGEPREITPRLLPNG